MLKSAFERMRARTRVLAVPPPELRVHPADEHDDRPSGNPEVEARHDRASDMADGLRDTAATAGV